MENSLRTEISETYTCIFLQHFDQVLEFTYLTYKLQVYDMMRYDVICSNCLDLKSPTYLPTYQNCLQKHPSARKVGTSMTLPRPEHMEYNRTRTETYANSNVM